MSEWISVKDEPPPEDSPFLLVVENDLGERHREIGCAVPSEDYGVIANEYVFAKPPVAFGVWLYLKVTHWQPLPELPEEE